MKEKRNIFLIGIIVVLLIVIAMGIVWVLQISRQNEKISQQENAGIFNTIEQDPNIILDMDDKSYQEMMTEMQKKVDEGMVDVKFKNNIIVPTNSNIASVHIENPISNTYDMFITLFLDETQEKICQTGIIPVGAAIQQLTLEKTLEDGEYTGIMVYNMINKEKQVVEQANLGVQISVGN